MTPIALGTGLTAASVSAGGLHVCAVLSNKQLKCWGFNSGVLGLGDAANRGDGLGEMGDALRAVSLGNGRTVSSVSAGFFHTCAILDNGGVKCWGSNGSGELGYGDTRMRGATASDMGDNLPYVDLGHE